MPPRRKLPRRNRGQKTRAWRAGKEPGRSILTKGRRSASRRVDRFSPLKAWQPEPELSPLHKIPSLRAWLAARAAMPRKISGTHAAC